MFNQSSCGNTAHNHSELSKPVGSDWVYIANNNLYMFPFFRATPESTLPQLSKSLAAEVVFQPLRYYVVRLHTFGSGE